MAGSWPEGPPRDGSDGAKGPRAEAALIVDVDGYEGPLDLLLTLARGQKVDLARISVLQLARQYLDFVDRARGLRMELAADYLVTAAWLAYLKARLLLPPDPAEDGPSAEEDAARLALRIERLEAIRGAAAALMARHRLGRDVHPRGAPEATGPARRVVQTATLLDLLRGYARVRTRDAFRPVVMDRVDVLTMEAALARLKPLAARSADWTALAAFLPDGWGADPARRRSATAACFAATLELARDGAVELRQDGAFGRVELRARA